MQRTATRVFVIASIVFGVVGSLFFITLVSGDGDSTPSRVLFAAWGVAGCAVLSSFAVSVAGKYLSEKNDPVSR